MAYLFKSGNNTYYRVTINRKGHKVNKLFHSFKEADRFEKATREAIDAGTYIDEDTKLLLIPTVRTLLEDYFTLIENNNSHYVAYKQTIKNKRFKLLTQIPSVQITLPDMQVYYSNYRTINNSNLDGSVPLGDFYIDTVDDYLIRRYVEARKEAGLKDGSISTEVIYIKSAFKVVNRLYPQLKSEDIFIQNPFDALTRADLPKRSPSRKKIISQENLDKALEFFSSKKNKQYLLAYKICLETGLRKTECLSIQLQNVSREKGEIYLPITKNGRPRTVKISEEILSLLPLEEITGPLFTISVSAINMEWSRCFKTLPKGSRPVWHSLKNTAISKALSDSKEFQIAENFQISVESLKQYQQDEELQKFFEKLLRGEKPTAEEASKYIGGHSSLGMTQKYFVDKK
ncbi:tyrosine-type recombinase/integrase [Azonexus sp. R2A61]|uniref:tyrosine-type recombinase/integrase n=1 Tax=Azonexus sp. R2A61 TaxID=2744443 RepID=UPI001F1D61AB|nr:tyrosine-type recombinase/integrase [Azonexus sp. R2A61]